MFKKFLLMLVLVTAFGLVGFGQESSKFSGSIRGENYVYKFTEKDFADNPSWKVEDGEPPLSIVRAVEISRKSLSRFVQNSETWKIRNIDLRQANKDKWFYLISFVCSSECRNSESRRFQIIVKMDGSILEPKKLVTVELD